MLCECSQWEATLNSLSKFREVKKENDGCISISKAVAPSAPKLALH